MSAHAPSRKSAAPRLARARHASDVASATPGI
jgi:hypothetical protein